MSYSQNDVLITRGPAPTGENTKRRQEEYDALGRLTSVWEITSSTGSGTCGQRNAQAGFWTKYSYDALGRLTGVTQNAQSASSQTRTYLYDLMGRLTSETNPESGTKTYVYDTDSTMCGNGAYTSNGDLVKTMDAVGNCVMRYYDALHRVTDIGNNHQSATNPCKRFRYDNTSGYPGSTKPSGLTHLLGRLAEVETDAGGLITDEWFSYTARGEVSDFYEFTPHSGGYYHTAATYFANGAVNLLTAPGGYSAQFNLDGEGRVYSTVPSVGALNGTQYNPAGQPTQVTFASGDIDTYSYDPNTGRMTQYKFTVGTTPQSLIGNLTWNANGTLASQNITDPFNSVDTQNCSYSHDDLSRLASVNCGAVFSQSFSYDAFGNISKSGTYSFQPTYNSATNRFSSIPGVTVSYDAAGNVLNDGSHGYSWDAYGKPVTVDSVALTYDALGRMVEQNRSGSYTEINYSPTGVRIELMNGQSYTKAFVPLPGGAVAVYGGGAVYFGHSDHLGSIKLGSTASRTVSWSLAYAPFGELYASSGTTDPAFTGQRQDTTPGLYDFLAREYSLQGRWSSPDPAGLGAASLGDPRTWNRYAYVSNSPLDSVDLAGLIRCPSATMGCDGGEDGAIGGCTVDGVDSGCGSAFTLLGIPQISGGYTGGAGVQCPDNDCALGTAIPFQCVGSVCGYMTVQYASSHPNICNGQLCTNGEWTTYLNDLADAQRRALADAISYASNSPDGRNWNEIYNNLNPYKIGTTDLNIQGGNVDFTWTGNDSDLAFVPQSAWATGGCTACRYGDMDEIHFNHNLFHLDTASPLWGYGAGLFLHGFVDVLLGNINPSVPIGR